MGDGSCVNLPPGFRFSPTDEELVLHFLYPKTFLLPFQANLIPDTDIHLHDPWELNSTTALSTGNMYYFFSKVIENRTTSSGYWKEIEADMDHDQPIFASGNQVGLKKYLVFCVGESPTGTETDWVMEEFSLCNNIGLISNTIVSACKRRRRQKSECKWVLCRVHEKKGSTMSSRQFFSNNIEDDDENELSCLDEVFFSLLDDDLEETSMQH